MATDTDQLKTILQEGKALIVCGAGVSAALTGGKAPGWAKLIKNALNFADPKTGTDPAWVRGCREQLADDATIADWLEAATTIRKKLDKRFRAFLQQELAGLTCEDKALMVALAAMEASGNVIATTNYDDVLSEGLGRKPVTWPVPESAMNVVTGESKGILHLHGHREDTASVIFSGEDYETIRQHAAAQFLQQLTAHQRHLVFLGCSKDGLADENIGELLNWFQTHWSGLGKQHFVLCLEKDKAGWPDAVTPIVYGSTHGDLTGFLKAIAPVPAPATLFPANPHMVGRQDQLRKVVAWLLDDTCRPIIIPGGPGLGKSTMAVQAAYDPDVVAKFGAAARHFVRLDSAATSDDMLRLLANALSLDARGSAAQILQSIVAACALPVLAILDNLETPLQQDRDAVEELLSHLADIAGLRLVVTVRGATPHLRGGAEQLPEILKLPERDARQVFETAAGNPFHDDKDFAALLQAMDGHPLSLVIVGRLANGQANLQHLLKRWTDEKARLLEAGDHRLNNVIVSLRLSLDVLGKEARRLLSLVAELPDGFAVEFANRILSKSAAKAMTELVQARLVDNINDRLFMLAPLREAVGSCLTVEAGDAQAFSAICEELLKEAGEAGREKWGDVKSRVVPEANNLNQMLEWLVRKAASADFAMCARGLCEFNRFTGLGSTTAIVSAANSRRAKADAQSEAHCLKSLGDIALDRSEHDGALARYEQALPLYTRVGNVLGEANCIKSLGNIALARSDPDGARARYEQALPLFARVGSVLGEANCIMSLGDIAFRRSDLDGAQARYEQALPLYARVGDMLGEANCIQSLGDIALERSDLDGAQARYEQALPPYAQLGSVMGEANCIYSLGDIALERSDHDGARARYEEALPLYRQVGDVLGEANSIQSLGDIVEREQSASAAAKLWQQALDLYARIPEPYSMGFAHRRLASATEGAEREAHMAEARRLWRSIGREDLVAELLPEE